MFFRSIIVTKIMTNRVELKYDPMVTFDEAIETLTRIPEDENSEEVRNFFKAVVGGCCHNIFIRSYTGADMNV